MLRAPRRVALVLFQNCDSHQHQRGGARDVQDETRGTVQRRGDRVVCPAAHVRTRVFDDARGHCTRGCRGNRLETAAAGKRSGDDAFHAARPGRGRRRARVQGRLREGCRARRPVRQRRRAELPGVGAVHPPRTRRDRGHAGLWPRASQRGEGAQGSARDADQRHADGCAVDRDVRWSRRARVRVRAAQWCGQGEGTHGVGADRGC